MLVAFSCLVLLSLICVCGPEIVWWLVNRK